MVSLTCTVWNSAQVNFLVLFYHTIYNTIILYFTTSVVNPPQSLSSADGKDKGSDYSTILGVTITVIAILVIVIVAGVVWFVIQKR